MNGRDDARLLLDSLDTCVCVSCFDTGEILYANRKVREEFGLKDESGRFCWQVFKEGAEGLCEDCPRYSDSLREGNYHIWEKYCPMAKKHYKHIDSIVTWMGTVAYMQHFMDVTEQKETEEALEAALKNSRHMNDAKSEFLSRMNHEIRTPMNTVTGMTKIAKQSSDEAEVKNCLDNIDAAAKQLKAIVNDIFDISKIVSRKLELVNAPFNFKKMMSDVYEQFKKQTDEKKQQFTFLLDDTINTMYVGDEARLSQVVGNLLSNAVKFTPEGGDITFSARQKERAGNEAVVEVSVSDSGIGISRENIAKLFSPFEQVDGSITRKYGGIGLGLVLCKNIVELMEGEFDVKSKEGKGSTFVFTAKFTTERDMPEESKEEAVVKEPEPPAPPEPAEEPVPSTPADDAGQSGQRPNFDGLMPFINVKRGLENLKGHGKLYAALLRSYQKNNMLAKIKDAVSADNFKEAIQHAQALKSIAANIALDDLRTKTHMLEESLRSFTSDDALIEKLEISTEETRKLIPGLIPAIEEGNF
ncbi:MAG: HAMP domain-containing histidine kinase [Synergistaceae bacterium]|nr:HAMP domain-containing histidine kinase [Synergistaceae bacterium]